MKSAVDRHIELYRGMGFKYKMQAYMLRSFAAFAEGRLQQFIRTDTVLEWAAAAPSIRQRHDRLLIVRRLACALNAEDGRHQVPPDDAFGRAVKSHRKCHIFTESELQRLFQTAAQLSARRSIQAFTFVALLSLITATGLRISEALRLQLSDITEDGLLIRATKFQKNRLVPLHATSRQGLKRYLDSRDRTKAVNASVFISKSGRAMPYSTVNTTFLYLARLAGLRPSQGLGGCRIHDLRHTFAVRSLEQFAGDRKAIAKHITALSTYLGHAHVSDTYWYLQATPKLLGNVAAAAEALYQGSR